MNDGRRILKFVVVPGVTAIETADDPRFLAVGVQSRDVVVWAEAMVGKGVVTKLGAVMTGEAPPVGSEYIGTTQMTTNIGQIVIHVYRQLVP